MKQIKFFYDNGAINGILYIVNDEIKSGFLVKEKKGIKILQGERVEHPDYIKEKNLKIDYLFYLTNQIMNPSIQFLELIMKPKDADKLFRDFIIAEEDKRKGRQSLLKAKFNISIDNSNDDFDFDNLINKSAKPDNNVESKKKINYLINA
jgi:hypothetical protein